jgi:hypothetical protein
LVEPEPGIGALADDLVPLPDPPLERRTMKLA